MGMICFAMSARLIEGPCLRYGALRHQDALRAEDGFELNGVPVEVHSIAEWLIGK
jgi:hypothetical protein